MPIIYTSLRKLNSWLGRFSFFLIMQWNLYFGRYFRFYRIPVKLSLRRTTAPYLSQHTNFNLCFKLYMLQYYLAINYFVTGACFAKFLTWIPIRFQIICNLKIAIIPNYYKNIYLFTYHFIYYFLLCFFYTILAEQYYSRKSLLFLRYIWCYSEKVYYLAYDQPLSCSNRSFHS